jgi:hypothetical protein
VATGKALPALSGWEKLAEKQPPGSLLETIFRARVFVPDEETLLVVCWTGTHTRLVFLDASSGRKLRELPPERGNVGRAALSPDGMTLALPAGPSRGGGVRLIEVGSGLERGRLEEGPQVVGALAFSPDGRLLACSEHPGAAVGIWHVGTGRALQRFQGHQSPPSSLSFSADGARLASAGMENTALVWDVRRLAGGPPPRLARADLDTLWAELSGVDGRLAHQAIWRLGGSPEPAVPFLRERLRSVPEPDAKRLPRLILELDADEFERRERASEELKALGRRAEAALQAALDRGPSPEVKRRAGVLLKRLREPGAPAPPSPELVALRVVEALEKAGTAEARTLLGELARGPAGRVTRAARAALARLNRRPADRP